MLNNFGFNEMALIFGFSIMLSYTNLYIWFVSEGSQD